MSNQLDTLLSRLSRVKPNGNGKWLACCPAHDDRSPSLAIKDDGGKILIHCFSGCETIDVLGAIGLDFADIMPDKVEGNFKREQKPFYASDVLKILKVEAQIIYLVAKDLVDGKVIDAEDLARLLLATNRVGKACEVANHGL